MPVEKEFAWTEGELAYFKRQHQQRVRDLLRVRETASDNNHMDAVSKIERELANIILGPLDKGTNAEGATSITRLLRALVQMEKETACISPKSEIPLPDRMVFADAARKSGVSVELALGLSDEVKARMRELTTWVHYKKAATSK